MPAPAPTRTWRARARARGSALALALLAALVGGEVLVRASVGAPRSERLPLLTVRAHPTRGFEMLPGEAHYTYRHRVAVNALGLRGPALPRERGTELRVLALGDSLIYGQGVADDRTVPALMQGYLAAREPAGPRPLVVNGGLRAYSTNQELALLYELAPRIEPDAVVLFWYWNDLLLPPVEQLCARLEQSGPVAFDTRARMEGAALLRWRIEQLVRRSALAMYLNDRLRARRGLGLDERQVEAGFERLDGWLGELAAWGREQGVAVGLCVVPDAGTVRGGHPSAALDARALELARAHGLPAAYPLAALRALRADTDEPLTIPFDGHYEGPANAAIARVASDLVPARATLEVRPIEAAAGR